MLQPLATRRSGARAASVSRAGGRGRRRRRVERRRGRCSPQHKAAAALTPQSRALAAGPGKRQPPEPLTRIPARTRRQGSPGATAETSHSPEAGSPIASVVEPRLLPRPWRDCRRDARARLTLSARARNAIPAAAAAFREPGPRLCRLGNGRHAQPAAREPWRASSSHGFMRPRRRPLSNHTTPRRDSEAPTTPVRGASWMTSARARLRRCAGQDRGLVPGCFGRSQS